MGHWTGATRVSNVRTLTVKNTPPISRGFDLVIIDDIECTPLAVVQKQKLIDWYYMELGNDNDE